MNSLEWFIWSAVISFAIVVIGGIVAINRRR